MVLEKLSESLRNSLSKIAKSMFVDEKLIDDLVRDIQRALLKADVNVKLVLDISKNIKKRMLEEQTPTGLTKKEYLIKIVYEELTQFMGGKESGISINKKPLIIMLVGLFGSGKTTTAGKLAKYYTKRGNKVSMIQTDIWRPAAYKQLKTLGDKINVPVYGDEKEKDPIKIYKKYWDQAKTSDIVIIDTAGRDALSNELIKEIEKLKKKTNPDEILLVISADIGQTAEKQAKQFNESCGITGVIATKMDGTAKAGGALTACSITKSPIKFIGVGESINDLERFNPEGFVGRILGMGDLEALIEKANEAMDQKEAEKMSRKMLKGEFNFLDLYDQLKTLNKMGSLSKLVNMIPGMNQIPKEMLQGQEGKLDVWKTIMKSMTKEELEDPKIISSTRIQRISKGSGIDEKEIRQLLKQYKMTKKMMKMFKGKNPDKMLKQMKGKIKI